MKRLFFPLALLVTPALAQNLDGIWMSDGYGLLAEIDAGRMQSY